MKLKNKNQESDAFLGGSRSLSEPKTNTSLSLDESSGTAGASTSSEELEEEHYSRRNRRIRCRHRFKPGKVSYSSQYEENEKQKHSGSEESSPSGDDITFRSSRHVYEVSTFTLYVFTSRDGPHSL
ncbi:unnamed protein product [Nezara viridula]|uniref:Uncharacterized protein n=1 Tax=Nezara viridula TaxID=85310 RepID=A0A9P0E4R0_NEZVI|nr:unnamed protein product [Nezara viridula]